MLLFCWWSVNVDDDELVSTHDCSVHVIARSTPQPEAHRLMHVQCSGGLTRGTPNPTFFPCTRDRLDASPFIGVFKATEIKWNAMALWGARQLPLKPFLILGCRKIVGTSSCGKILVQKCKIWQLKTLILEFFLADMKFWTSCRKCAVVCQNSVRNVQCPSENYNFLLTF